MMGVKGLWDLIVCASLSECTHGFSLTRALAHSLTHSLTYAEAFLTHTLCDKHPLSHTHTHCVTQSHSYTLSYKLSHRKTNLDDDGKQSSIEHVEKIRKLVKRLRTRFSCIYDGLTSGCIEEKRTKIKEEQN